MNIFAKAAGKLNVVSLLAVFFMSACAPDGGGQGGDAEARVVTGEVNVYSGRHYDSDIAIYDAFTEETGIRVNVIEAGGDALIERIAREAAASPADLFITADAGILWRADQRGVFRTTDNNALEARVPAQFRHPEGKWFGLSKRARIVIYNKDQGLPEGLETYADLADPAYEGMICVRSSSNIYNQSLLASRIAHFGEEAAEDWARGVVANFARRPQGNDTSQIEAVAAGLCRLGIVNSYYVARYVGSDNADNAAIGEKVGVFFPDQAGNGAHVNVSGAGVTAHAPNAENAEALLAFLLRDETQSAFAQGNNEYPVAPSVAPSGSVAELGDFVADDLPVAALGENQRAAVQIFDRVGWP
ncbi:MAG: Fe(3+) ABC transporter substrate-binding protein [Pseudomonadota bacterium]